MPKCNSITSTAIDYVVLDNIIGICYVDSLYRVLISPPPTVPICCLQCCQLLLSLEESIVTHLSSMPDQKRCQQNFAGILSEHNSPQSCLYRAYITIPIPPSTFCMSKPLNRYITSLFCFQATLWFPPPDTRDLGSIRDIGYVCDATSTDVAGAVVRKGSSYMYPEATCTVSPAATTPPACWMVAQGCRGQANGRIAAARRKT